MSVASPTLVCAPTTEPRRRALRLSLPAPRAPATHHESDELGLLVDGRLREDPLQVAAHRSLRAQTEAEPSPFRNSAQVFLASRLAFDRVDFTAPTPAMLKTFDSLGDGCGSRRSVWKTQNEFDGALDRSHRGNSVAGRRYAASSGRESSFHSLGLA